MLNFWDIAHDRVLSFSFEQKAIERCTWSKNLRNCLQRYYHQQQGCAKRIWLRGQDPLVNVDSPKFPIQRTPVFAWAFQAAKVEIKTWRVHANEGTQKIEELMKRSRSNLLAPSLRGPGSKTEGRGTASRAPDRRTLKRDCAMTFCLTHSSWSRKRCFRVRMLRSPDPKS